MNRLLHLPHAFSCKRLIFSLLYFTAYDSQNLCLLRYRLRCDFVSFGAEPFCGCTVIEPGCIDTYVELCSENCAACGKSTYSGVRYRCRIAF